MSEVDELIARFGLLPLPQEGGRFAPVWRSPERAAGPGGAERAAASSILYLLAAGEFSALHRLCGDEVWQFHAGDALELFRLDPAGVGGWVRLGPAVAADDAPQVVVPRGHWQGARLAPGGRWALVGCTLVPGWDEADFALGERAALLAAFPQWAGAIVALTRQA